MAYSREQLEDAIGVVIGAFGRFNSYELDEDRLTANFKSNSGRSDRQVYIDFDEEDGEYTGGMTVSQSEYYPGDSAGWGLANHITDALKNPEEYELFDYEDRRIYPEKLDNYDLDYSNDKESDDSGWLIGAIALAIAAGIGAGVCQGVKYIRRRLKNKPIEGSETFSIAEGIEMVEKGSAVEVMQVSSKVAHILNELPEDASLDQFKEAFNEAREIDPRSLYFFICKNKDRFTPDMIQYAQRFYERKI